jgi:hypothetical protein
MRRTRCRSRCTGVYGVLTRWCERAHSRVGYPSGQDAYVQCPLAYGVARPVKGDPSVSKGAPGMSAASAAKEGRAAFLQISCCIASCSPATRSRCFLQLGREGMHAFSVGYGGRGGPGQKQAVRTTDAETAWTPCSGNPLDPPGCRGAERLPIPAFASATD